MKNKFLREENGTIKKQALNYADYINPVLNEAKVFTREEIAGLSKEEFDKHEKEILAQMKFLGVPTEQELAQNNAHDYENDETLEWLWITQGDDRVCADCEALDGTTYKSEEDAPDIPLHPNCRCVLVRTVVA